MVGTGIAGLVTARALTRGHDVTVYEAADRLGGHSHTIDVPLNGSTFAVDTGFVVFNQRTYPNFTRLLAELGIASEPSVMSFSVKCERTGIEYAGGSLDGLFAQRGNALRPSFLAMLRDVVRFQRDSKRLLADREQSLTLGEYLAARRYSEGFVERYLIPLGASIWSADPGQFLEFPARRLLEFFDDHGLLGLRGRPAWQCVVGGSRRYVEAMTHAFRDRIRLRAPVRRVARHRDHVEVCADGVGSARFDRVVIAAHSDQALAMLDCPTPGEVEVLGAIRFRPNDALLHTDPAVLPRRRAWAAWNYHVPRESSVGVTITYNMNILQGLKAPEQFCVTLNRSKRVDPTRVIRRLTFHHPVFDAHALAAQARWAEISGVDRVHYCGAYWGNGFHEDGVNSGLAVARQFGVCL